MLLQTIQGPPDVQRLTREEAVELAAEIRTFLVDAVSRTGGHLGPNLGVVELTIALHRVFDSPQDTLVFDTGHQTYVHKLLTGRHDFTRLKKTGGLSGYPSRAESPHDVVENSHATTALSWGEGIAKARRLRGESGRHVVAVIGDGALTGGMAWEAINNIAVDEDLPLTIVVNDNERSYATTTGGLARHLATLRTTRGYERFLSWGKQALGRTPVVGGAVYETLHGVKKGLKDIVAPQGMFEDLGLKYVGPVDGHDIEAVERALRQARAYGGPVLVHVITQKGHGYPPALADEGDRFHAVGPIDARTGAPLPSSAGQGWTDVFADEMLRAGGERPDLVAITAAMSIPVGLERFAQAYPSRVFDVGIAEQHATTSAAGLAYGGLHPVFAVYATFLNRAFDQVLMDVALHRAGVTFVLDRSGITGNDGPSHHGMWDLSLMQVVPGVRVAAPRDAATLRVELREALDVGDGPTVLRYSKGTVPAEDIPAVERVGQADVLRRSPDADVLIVAVGAMVPTCLEVAERLVSHGMQATVVDPRWVIPVDPALVELAGQHRLVVVVEDNLRVGGVGSRIAQEVRDAGLATPVVDLGVPIQFVDHGDRRDVLAAFGLTGQDVTRRVVEELARREPAMEDAQVADDRR
jgi:1-deoxy-D-xylulose-5-phosphate synthase